MSAASGPSTSGLLRDRPRRGATTIRQAAVVGATGFLGSTLCRQLLAANVAVRAVSRRRAPPDVGAAAGGGASRPAWVTCELNDPDGLARAFAGVDVVFHVAACVRYGRRQARPLQEVNVDGLRRSLAACHLAGVERVVVADTISVFEVAASAALRPLSATRLARGWLYPYVRSKARAHAVIDAARRTNDVRVVFLSPMYGAGDVNEHTSTLIRQLATRRTIVAPPGGTSVIGVADAADACVGVAEIGVSARGGKFIAVADHLSFAELYSMILAAVGSSATLACTLPRWTYLPAMIAASVADLFFPETMFCPYLVRNGYHFRNFDAEATWAAVGFRPRVAIADAIAEQICWLRETGRLPSPTTTYR